MSWLDDLLYKRSPIFDEYPRLPELTVPAEPGWDQVLRKRKKNPLDLKAWGGGDFPEPLDESALPLPEDAGGGSISIRKPWAADAAAAAWEGAVNPPERQIPQIDMGGGLADISRRPVQIGEENTRTSMLPGLGRKTRLGKALLDILPRALEAGVAGAATQNVAGGGPTDIFRAMMGGRAALEKRDANRLALEEHFLDRERQEEDRARAAELRESQMNENVAQSEYYRALASKQAQGERTFYQKYTEAYAGLILAGWNPEQARERATILAGGGSLQNMKPNDQNEGLIEIPESHPYSMMVTPRTDPKTGQKSWWIPRSWNMPGGGGGGGRAGRQTSSLPRKIGEYVGSDGFKRILMQDPEGKVDEHTTKQKVKTPQPKKAPPLNKAPYMKLETKKNDDLAKAKKVWSEKSAKIREKVPFTDPVGSSNDAITSNHKKRVAWKAQQDQLDKELQEERDRIMAEFNNGIAILSQERMDKLEAIRAENESAGAAAAEEETAAEEPEDQSGQAAAGGRVPPWRVSGIGKKR